MKQNKQKKNQVPSFADSCARQRHASPSALANALGKAGDREPKNVPGSQVRRAHWPKRSAKASCSPSGGQHRARQRILQKKRKHKKKMGPSLRRARRTGRSAKAPSPSNTAVTATTCRREGGGRSATVRRQPVFRRSAKSVYADSKFSERASLTATLGELFADGLGFFAERFWRSANLLYSVVILDFCTLALKRYLSRDW